MEYAKVQVKGSDILSSSPKRDREYRVATYDFKRPDKFSLEQIRTVSIIHETFARLTTTSMSAQLRHKVHINVKCVDQLTFDEFLRSIPNPTTMAIIQMTPLLGSALLEIDPDITSAIIDRLAGGSGEASDVNRQLSPMEQSIMEGMTERMLGDLRESWTTVLDMCPSLGQIETNPQFALIVPPMEMVLLVSFEISVGDVKGIMNFCIPYLTIEPIIGKLSASYWYSSVRKNNKGCMTEKITSFLKMDTEIISGTEQLSLKQLGSLKKGSLIKLDDFQSKSASLRMGGEVLLPISLKRTRKGYICNIKNDSEEGQEDFFNLLEVEPQQTIENNLNESITNLSNQITNVSSNLTLRIEELVNNQDHLNDQVFLQSNSEQSSLVQENQPFSYIGFSDLPALYQMLSEDHHQLIALILSRLKPELSARLLEMFPPELQPDLIRRIGKIEKIAPVIIKLIENVLQNSIKRMNENLEIDVEGVDKVVEILNVISRSVEKNVIINIEKTDSDLAEEIKNRMFVFEDIVILDEASVKRIVDQVDFNDLCLSLKIINEESVKMYVLNCISPDQKKKLVKGIEVLGRVKISDVDKAQLRVVAKIREMEENGEIAVCHPDETVD